MRISPFELERYFAEHEFSVPYLLCCSDCESLAVGELLAMEEGAADALQRLWLGYTESQGHPLLREQIASLYAGIDMDHVLVHAGAEEAIFNLMNVWLQPGDHVIVHSPCYQSLFEVARAVGCEVTRWQTTEKTSWALDLDWLRDHLRPETRMVVINCPHNPTGYLMPRDLFDDLVSLSQQHGFLLFSDEVYRWLEYDPCDRLPALCEVDERGASLGVMSKSFGLAGLRIGWIVTRNADLYARLAAFKDYTTICCSAPSELLSIVALRNRDRILRRNLEIVQENLGLLDRFFAGHADLFSWSRPKAGPIAFPSFKGGDVERFCHDLVTQAGVLLLPGTMYGPGYTHFRIGFGRRNVRECLEALDAYLETGWKAR
jgi:aspartate/methionine/tyrosine aminotransferase